MIKIITLVSLCLVCSISAAQDFKWELSLSERIEGTATIRAHEKLGLSVLGLVSSIPNNIRVRGVHINLYNGNKPLPMHAELMALLELSAPIELENALKSSGNMHNPAVNLLKEPLTVAIKESQFVQPLLNALERKGYVTGGVSFEKLRILNKELIQAGVYITLHKSS